jgi:hypothetical protein
VESSNGTVLIWAMNYLTHHPAQSAGKWKERGGFCDSEDARCGPTPPEELQPQRGAISQLRATPWVPTARRGRRALKGRYTFLAACVKHYDYSRCPTLTGLLDLIGVAIDPGRCPISANLISGATESPRSGCRHFGPRRASRGKNVAERILSPVGGDIWRCSLRVQHHPRAAFARRNP